MLNCVRALRVHRCAIGAVLIAAVHVFSSRGEAVENRAKLDSHLERDDYDLATTRMGAEIIHERDGLGLHLRGRWFSYSLDRNLVGIRPFVGSEPAFDLGGHWLVGLWWLAGSAGAQGSMRGVDATGSVVVARALTWGASTLTPRVTIGRQPLALSALPLSLGMKVLHAEGALALRSSGWIGEIMARADWWNGMTAEGRVENPALATIPSNRRMLASAYVLSQGWWLQGGLLAKVLNGQHNTLLPTQTAPFYAYTFYPISVPLWAWEASLVARAIGSLFSSLDALLQIQIPLVSRELRRWESVEQWSWGTAAWEARAELTWHITQGTQVSLGGFLFAKPWANWDVGGADGYRQIALQAGITQRL